MKKSKITLEDLEKRIQALEFVIRLLPIKRESYPVMVMPQGIYCKWCGGITNNCPGHSIC